MSSNPTTAITTDTNGDMSSSAPIAASSSFPAVIELNVGGVFYTTSLTTLTQDPDSLLSQMFTGSAKTPITRDSKGKYFVDRDGVLFRYVLDFLRNRKLVLPEGFHERSRLRQEAEYFGLDAMVEEVCGGGFAGLQSGMSSLLTAKGTGYLSPSEVAGKPGYVTIGYRGSFAFGRDGLADVKFRKLSRILICGRITLCREVFGDTLNESRDPDRGCVDRYTSRFFLKHTFLEQAFDMLLEAGFRCLAAAGSGTSGGSGVDLKPGMDSEESRWNHYNEFVFARLPQF